MQDKNRDQKCLLDKSTENLDLKTLSCLKVAKKIALTLISEKKRVKNKLGHRSELTLERRSKSLLIEKDDILTIKKLKNKRMLIVNDITTSLEAVENNLNQWGIKNIYLLRNALGALHQLELSIENKQPIDVLLLDVCLQGIEGLAMAKIIKNDNRFKELKIVMLISSDNIEYLDDSNSFHLVDAWLTKPIRPSNLLNSLRLAVI